VTYPSVTASAEMPRENLKLGPGGDTGPVNDMLRKTTERIGANIMGKRMFEQGERAWPEEAPFHTPVYVLTHEKREPWVRPGASRRAKGADMIAAIVMFRLGDHFDEQSVRSIAETARARFEGMPGLRSKAFTFDPARREATNFYVWDSEDAARAFFTDEMLERVAGLYGVRPTVEIVQVATLVENART
jgi:heme-degrading monooxygenase HmoA